jgi:hypothetical protein
MVWIKNVGMKPCYVCGECGLGYRDPKTAMSCEEYCRKNSSCSLEISKKSIYKP